ncbi:MAG: M20 family metallopeptidase [Chloroflexaceae bacterium]|nr:M20 family metallopeptidase [Chloroflexaceae bacterium]
MSLPDDLIMLTSDLIRFQSTAHQPEQIAAAADYIAAFLETIPNIFIHRSEAQGVPSLVATLHDTRHPTLMLNGHFDVVAAAPALFAPRVADGRIIGRGSQDMKGSLAVMLCLLRDLAQLEPRPNIGMQFVGDEEIGGKYGTERLVAEGWHCDFCITTEPTELRICYQQKGAMWLTLRLPGSPTHASRPWDGRNPIYPYAEGVLALAGQFPPPTHEVWRTTATPTILNSGGNSPNQVASALDFSIDIRYTDEHTPPKLLELVQQAFVGVEIVTAKHSDGLSADPEHPAIQRLAQITQARRGVPTPLYREHYGSDARFFTQAGMPAVCFGPTGTGLHSDYEWVEVDSLVALYDVLYATCTE